MNLACLMMALSLVAQPDGGAKESALPRAIADAFLSNQKSFPFGRATFTFKRGTAGNDGAARKGELDPVYTAKCLYVFNGPSARYERIFPDEELRAANKQIGHDVMSIIDTYRIATNGEVSLYDTLSVAGTIHAHGTRLTPGVLDFERDFQFPLALGRPDKQSLDNLGKHLQEAIKGAPGSSLTIQSVEEHVSFEGREVVKLTLASEFDTTEYWVDLERGAVPLKIIQHAKPAANTAAFETIYYLDDLHNVPGRGWLPFRESWWYSFNKSGYQIILEDLSLEKPPAEAAFAIDFPEPTALIDERKAIRYPPQRSWNVLRLPRPGARGVEKVQYPTIAESEIPRMPGELPSQSRYDLLLYGAAALILAFGLVLWRRSRSDGP